MCCYLLHHKYSSPMCDIQTIHIIHDNIHIFYIHIYFISIIFASEALILSRTHVELPCRLGFVFRIISLPVISSCNWISVFSLKCPFMILFLREILGPTIPHNFLYWLFQYPWLPAVLVILLRSLDLSNLLSSASLTFQLALSLSAVSNNRNRRSRCSYHNPNPLPLPFSFSSLWENYNKFIVTYEK